MCSCNSLCTHRGQLGISSVTVSTLFPISKPLFAIKYAKTVIHNNGNSCIHRIRDRLQCPSSCNYNLERTFPRQKYKSSYAHAHTCADIYSTEESHVRNPGRQTERKHVFTQECAHLSFLMSLRQMTYSGAESLCSVWFICITTGTIYEDGALLALHLMFQLLQYLVAW